MIRRSVLAVLRAVALVALSLACIVGALYFTLPHATAVESRSIAHGPVSLPWHFNETGNPVSLQVTLQGRWIIPHVWNLVPNDKLRAVHVNGQEVPLARIPPEKLSDTWNGVMLDFGPWLRPGDNVIDILVENKNGPGGIALHPRLGNRVGLLALAFMPWLALLAHWFRLDRRQIAILVVGLVFLALYWTKTPWNERQHDVAGHLEYMEYLLHRHLCRHRTAAGPSSTRRSTTSPARSLLAAMQALHVVGYECLQAYSLVLWLLFLAASAGTLRLATRGWGLYAATAALCLWPTGIIHGIRIGNDLMLYACTGVATWFIVQWWQHDCRRHLLLAAFFCGLGMLAKSNGMVLVCTLGALFVLRTSRFARWGLRRTWIDGGSAAVLVLTGVALSLSNGVIYYLRGRIPNWLVANTDRLPEHLRVPNDLSCYLALDVPTFLTQPWYDSGREETGRRNFWNALLRTSLSGEWSYWDSPTRMRIAYVWGACLFVLLCLLVKPAFRLLRTRRTAWREAPWLLLGFGWVSSLMVLRYKAPFSCSNDFRYVLPVLVPFLLAAVRTGKLAQWLLVVIAAASALFTLTY